MMYIIIALLLFLLLISWIDDSYAATFFSTFDDYDGDRHPSPESNPISESDESQPSQQVLRLLNGEIGSLPLSAPVVAEKRESLHQHPQDHQDAGKVPA